MVALTERKEILRRDNRCFVCLQVGHRANQCHPSKKCRRCEGRHHQSICEKSATPTKKEVQKEGGAKVGKQDSPGAGTGENQTVTGARIRQQQPHEPNARYFYKQRLRMLTRKFKVL